MPRNSRARMWIFRCPCPLGPDLDRSSCAPTQLVALSCVHKGCLNHRPCILWKPAHENQNTLTPRLCSTHSSDCLGTRKQPRHQHVDTVHAQLSCCIGVGLQPAQQVQWPLSCGQQAIPTRQTKRLSQWAQRTWVWRYPGAATAVARCLLAPKLCISCTTSPPKPQPFV